MVQPFNRSQLCLPSNGLGGHNRENDRFLTLTFDLSQEHLHAVCVGVSCFDLAMKESC